MGSIDRVAVKMYKYLGGSKSVAERSSKELADTLRSQLKGKSRTDKKKFIKACDTLVNPSGKDVKSAENIILKTCTKGKSIYTGKIEGITTYADITTSLAMKRELNEARTKAVSEIADSLAHINFPDIRLTTDDIARITKDAYKETLKSNGTFLSRAASYPVNKVLSYMLPKNLRSLYGETAQLSRENFANGYLGRLVSLKNLSNRAPISVSITKDSAPLGVKAVGGFDGVTNKITYSREFPGLSRSAQASLLSHELKHLEQTDSVIRTVGVDRYISALKKQALNKLKRSSNGKMSEQELLNKVEENFKQNKIAETVRESFAPSVKAAKIDPKSKDGIQAIKYLDAIENYHAPTSKDPFGLVFDMPKEYFQNLLEKEAYKTGRNEWLKMHIFERLNLKDL